MLYCGRFRNIEPELFLELFLMPDFFEPLSHVVKLRFHSDIDIETEP